MRGGCAPQKSHQPFRKFRQFTPTKSTASFLASEMALRKERTEVFVADPIFHQQGQESAIFHRQVRADDGAHAMLAAGGRKALRPVNTIAIEQSDCGQSELSRARGELLRERSTAKKTEGAAGMQFDIGHGFFVAALESCRVEADGMTNRATLERLIAATSSVINTFEFPFIAPFLTAADAPIGQLQIPLCTLPLFCVPPISRSPVGSLLCDCRRRLHG